MLSTLLWVLSTAQGPAPGLLRPYPLTLPCALPPLRGTPACDPAEDAEARIADLIDRIPAAELRNLVSDQADGVPSLNIPYYNWWSEALHGVSKCPYTTNATWPPSADPVADVDEREARAARCLVARELGEDPVERAPAHVDRDLRSSGPARVVYPSEGCGDRKKNPERKVVPVRVGRRREDARVQVVGPFGATDALPLRREREGGAAQRRK